MHAVRVWWWREEHWEFKASLGNKGRTHLKQKEKERNRLNFL
jgi:hypothetical protein